MQEQCIIAPGQPGTQAMSSCRQMLVPCLQLVTVFDHVSPVQAKSATKEGMQRVKDLMRWFQSRAMPEDDQQPDTEPLHRPWRG